MSRWLWKPSYLVIIPMLLLIGVALACGEDATPTPTQVPATATPAATALPAPTATPVPPTATPVPTGPVAKYGGVVPAMAFPGVHGWDPHRYASAEDIVVNGNIYNQLVEYDPLNVGQIIGDLAESWDISSDALTYTFNLRDNVKWTDGQALDADDVVFSLNRMIDNSTDPRPKAGVWRSYLVENAVAKVDQSTVSMKLAFSTGAFIRFMAVDFNKILPQHILEAGGDIDTWNTGAVGSGPWKRVDWKEGISIEFEKNEGYFKEGRPFFDGIKGFYMTDKGTEIANYKTERILMGMSVQSQMDAEDALKLESDPEFSAKFDIFWMPGGGGGHNMWMNMAKEPFDNEKVRRAIFLAFDRHQITDHFGQGKYEVAAPMISLNPNALTKEQLLEVPGYRLKDGKKHPDDLAAAKKLMEEAGFAAGFKTTMLVPTIVFWPDAAQVIKQQLKNDLNIDIELILTDIGSAVGKLGEGDYDLGMFGAGISVPDPDDRFQSIYLQGGPRNFNKDYEVPGTRALFDKQHLEPDAEKRKALNHEMQLLVLNGPFPVVEYLYMAFAAPVSKRIMTEKGQFIQPETQYVALKHEHEWLEPE